VPDRLNTTRSHKLSFTSSTGSRDELLTEISEFVVQTDGLNIQVNETHMEATIVQELDGKNMTFSTSKVSEILHRKDSDGKDFIQINFESGIKVLLTNTLVGFKPAITPGLDMDRLPKVVTTPDLQSVSDAISEALSSEFSHHQEVEILKRVFEAVIKGGELAGFTLCEEKDWLDRLLSSKIEASA
jgi:hypothetical protein